MLSKHHKATIASNANFRNAIGCLCFIGPNLKTSIAMHVSLFLLQKLKTWEKMPRGELATQ